MAGRKRKIQPKEDSKVQMTKRGRQVKRVNYKMDYLDDSSDEDSSRDPKRREKKEVDSDDEFEMQPGGEKSESEQESVFEEESQSPSVQESEESIVMESKKGKRKAQAKKGKAAKPEVRVYDNMTNISNGGSSTTFLPNTITPIKKKKNPFELGEDVDEIDGQKVPDFIRKEFIRDKNLRKPDDPEYDPSSIDIPAEMFEKLTPGMKQYWEIKKDHFDSVVLWRKGDWYIVFYQDIHALNLVADGNPRTFHNEPGFYHNRVDQYINSLIREGYKVVRVEQTETHEMMKDRINEEKKKKNKDKKMIKEAVVGREIVGKYTKGTFLKPISIQDFLNEKAEEDEELDTKYVLLYLYDEENNVFGITYFDITTLKFFIGQFEDDSMRNKFRTLCTRIRPVEVLCEAKYRKSDMTKMLQSSPIPPTFTFLPSVNKVDYKTCKDLITEYCESNSGKIPKLLETAIGDFNNYNLAISSLGNSIKYLEHLMIAKNTVPLAEFHEYSHERSSEFGPLKENTAMVLDAQALENLEILEVQGQLSRITKGSLLHHLDRCSTKFGKRLLKKWLCSPLFNEKKLQARLNAVEELVNNYEMVEKFKIKMRKFADLERYLCRIYKYSISTQSNAIYVDINSITRLDELFLLLTQLKDIVDVLDEVFGTREHLTSKRLKALTTFESDKFKEGFGTKKTRKAKSKKKKKSTKKIEESKSDQDHTDLNVNSEDENEQAEEYKERIKAKSDDDGILPDIRDHLYNFERVITWKKIGNKNIPEPVPGLSEEFDTANEKVEGLKKDIQKLLANAKKELEFPELRYNIGSKRYRFEFDVKNTANVEVPESWSVTTKSKLYTRYQSPELSELVDQLEVAEEELKDAISPFLTKLFKKFYKKQYLWSDFVACIAEIDCLMSLAEVSKIEDDMVKPIIIPRESPNQKPVLELKDVKHPCVKKMVKDFVPNDVYLGGDNPLVNLITGPNMGGKSTLLRQTCIAVIMAQVGCYVPASECRMTIFDRIFTRIGANDRILENKSTFFVEMEETKAIVEQSSPYSLVIMDELGRGTSTFDGYSIAHAVLTYQTKFNKCLTLFTTHYHMLVDSFKEDPEVQPMKMSFAIDDDSGDVKFLYKFIKGFTMESQGIYVAKMARVPQSILEKAKIKSDQFREKLKVLEEKCRIRSKKKEEMAVDGKKV